MRKLQKAKVYVLLGFVMTLHLLLAGELQAGSGSVIILNNTRSNVTILTLRIDKYGYRSWHRIGSVRPGRQITLPGVVEGTQFGIKVGVQQRNPFTVMYPPNRSVFVYNVN